MHNPELLRRHLTDLGGVRETTDLNLSTLTLTPGASGEIDLHLCGGDQHIRLSGAPALIEQALRVSMPLPWKQAEADYEAGCESSATDPVRPVGDLPPERLGALGQAVPRQLDQTLYTGVRLDIYPMNLSDSREVYEVFLCLPGGTRQVEAETPEDVLERTVALLPLLTGDAGEGNAQQLEEVN